MVKLVSNISNRVRADVSMKQVLQLRSRLELTRMIYVFSSKLHGSKQLCSVAFSRDAIPTVQVRTGRLAARSTFIEAHQAVSSFTTPFVYFCEDVRMCNGRNQSLFHKRRLFSLFCCPTGRSIFSFYRSRGCFPTITSACISSNTKTYGGFRRIGYNR